MRALALIMLLVASGAGFASGALADEQPRCADLVPQQRPQNTPQAFVGRSFDEITASGFVEFAVYEDNPPYAYQVNGKAMGVDIDIGTLIAGALDVKPHFRFVAAGENLDADLLNYVWKGATVNGHVSDVLMRVPYNSTYACRVDQVFFTAQYAGETIAIAYDKAYFGEDAPSPAYFRYDTVGVENDSISDFYLTGMANGQVQGNMKRFRRSKPRWMPWGKGKYRRSWGRSHSLWRG